MSGSIAQRGFIYQTLIAMIESLEREDWDKIKLEPNTEADKVDIQLYQKDLILKAIQVKTSQNKFEQPDVQRWLESVRTDAPDAKEVAVYLVGDKYTSTCKEYIKETSDIKTFPFVSLDIHCRMKLQDYIEREGRGSQVDEDEFRIVFNNIFAELHNNSILSEPFSREDFRGWLLRVLSFPKCLNVIPTINRDVGLIGREAELHDVREMLDRDGCIALISGLGGIGKTAIMRWVCNGIVEDGIANTHVAWINCGASLKDDLLFLRDSFGIAEGGSDSEDYKKIINKMRNFMGTLYLFMDNMSRIPSSEEKAILNSFRPNVHIMITARHQIADIPCKDLETLMPESALDMFYKYYERDMDRRYVVSARNIIGTVCRHTLLVELLARAARRSGGTLDDFNEELKNKGFFAVFKRPINTKHDENLTIEKSIIKLYEISGLTESQQHVMKLFSLFSSEKEIYYKVAEWADLDMLAIDALVDLAWLERSGEENNYKIHQIIKESLMRQMKTRGEKLDFNAYGELLIRVSDINSYMPKFLVYTKIQERMVLMEDISRILLYRIGEIQERGEIFEAEKPTLEQAIMLFHQMGYMYHTQGKYSQALDQYKKIIDILELGNYSLTWDVTTTYDNMSVIYSDQGDYENALKYCEEALAIRKQLSEFKHPYMSVSYNNMANIYEKMKDFEKALHFYNRAIHEQETNVDSDPLVTATMYHNIAGIYTAQKEYEKAQVFYEKALEIREKKLVKDHPDTAMTYNNMAVMYEEQGEHEKARKFYERALDVQERLLGPEHPITTKIYHNLAGICYLQGEPEKAQEYYDKAFLTRKRVLGSTHPSTELTYKKYLAMCNEQGVYTQARGDYKKALMWYNKALNISECMLGSGHSDIAMIHNAIAGVYYAMSDYDNAGKHYDVARNSCEHVVESEPILTATIYNNIALVYLAQGNYEEAKKYCKKALKIRKKELGVDHPDTQTTYNNLALVYTDLGNYSRAEKIYQKVIDVITQTLGPDHFSLVTLYNNIAHVKNAQGNNKEALICYQGAITICKKVLGADHPDIATIYNNMAGLYEEQRNYTVALNYYNKALSIQERRLGSNHPSTAITNYNLARVFANRGDHIRALTLGRKALSVFKRRLGENHEDTQMTQRFIEHLEKCVQKGSEDNAD